MNETVWSSSSTIEKLILWCTKLLLLLRIKKLLFSLIPYRIFLAFIIKKIRCSFASTFIRFNVHSFVFRLGNTFLYVHFCNVNTAVYIFSRSICLCTRCVVVHILHTFSCLALIVIVIFVAIVIVVIWCVIYLL